MYVHETTKAKQIFLGALLAFSLLTSVATSAQQKSPLDTLVGGGKRCEYVANGKYLPYSDVDKDFPVFGKLVDKEGCVDVTNQVDDMFETGFRVFLSVVTLLAVANIAYAGIQWMVTEKDTGKKRGARKRLTDSVVGLVLALSGWVILSTVNPRLLDLGIDLTKTDAAKLIQKGLQQAKDNVAVVTESGCTLGEKGCVDGQQGGTGNQGPNGNPGTVGGATTGNPATGTKDPTGAVTPSSPPTVFGYRDGNGTVGNKGDNGLGNGSLSPIPGWTYYNGGAHNPTGQANLYSQGVALPLNTLRADFGSIDKVSDGGYELFVNGQSIGVFPVVDNSQEKLDLTFGLVKTYFAPNITSSNGWSGSGKNITYKALPNYWMEHQRPQQPMIKDSFSKASPTADEVDFVIKTNPDNFRIQ